jgi:hypothetical protein
MIRTFRTFAGVAEVDGRRVYGWDVGSARAPRQKRTPVATAQPTPGWDAPQS